MLASLLFLGCTTKHPFSDWGYEGVRNPEHWHEISTQAKMCRAGHHQSPINIKSNDVETLKQELEVFYHEADVILFNNGHTVEFDMTDSNYILVDQTKYQLEQFHFHRHSEHSLDDQFYPAEIHLVHRSQEGEVVVLAVFLEFGSSLSLDHIFDQIPDRGEKLKTRIHIEELVPKNKFRYVYDGSLTTPPCDENVTWIIFSEPIKISQSQLEIFQLYYSKNYRPLQKIHLRKVYKSFF